MTQELLTPPMTPPEESVSFYFDINNVIEIFKNN